jgi:hypothetical protein
MYFLGTTVTAPEQIKTTPLEKLHKSKNKTFAAFINLSNHPGLKYRANTLGH